MPNAPLRVGVAGLGQGRSHLAAFQAQEDVDVCAVADLDVAKRNAASRDYGIPRTYGTVDELLDDREIDLVVIATPDHMHGRHAIQALTAGKHVLSEIPMATTITECQEIIAITTATGLKYQMGNQVRYAHCLQDIHDLLAGGDLGELFYGEGEYLHNLGDLISQRGPDHWRVHGPVPQTTLLGGGPHALDTLRWLMGTTFTHVSAFNSSNQTEWGTTHTTVAIYKAASGAAAKITTSYGMIRPYCLYFSVYGTAGSFERTRQQVSPDRDTQNYYYHSKLSGSSEMIPVQLPNFTNPQFRALAHGHGTMEFEQARDFVASIRDDTEPKLGPRQAAASIVPLICGSELAEAGGGFREIPSLV